MVDCCGGDLDDKVEKEINCPTCYIAGKIVQQITIKSMLKPHALETLNGQNIHYICVNVKCDTIYFDTDKKIYPKDKVKAPVFQKDNLDDYTIPVCYCFNWTKEKIMQYNEVGKENDVIGNIIHHLKEGRCGCEVNNPQGSCCLGNVRSFINEINS